MITRCPGQHMDTSTNLGTINPPSTNGSPTWIRSKWTVNFSKCQKIRKFHRQLSTTNMVGNRLFIFFLGFFYLFFLNFGFSIFFNFFLQAWNEIFSNYIEWIKLSPPKTPFFKFQSKTLANIRVGIKHENWLVVCSNLALLYTGVQKN